MTIKATIKVQIDSREQDDDPERVAEEAAFTALEAISSDEALDILSAAGIATCDQVKWQEMTVVDTETKPKGVTP